MPTARSRIETNLARIRDHIAAACSRANRSPQGVTIVAVTKTVGIESIKALVDLGLTELGESRVQQLTDRSAELAAALRRRNGTAPAVRWHMIGHLQRNKVKHVLDVPAVIHSVDSLRLAEDIHARSEAAGTVADILLQVNCSAEPQKFGVAAGAALHLAGLMSSLKCVRLVGLMTMAPLVRDPQEARPTFTRLRELFDEMRHEGVCGEAFRHLSMGMSQDYAVAVEEGATLLRIGRALFQ